MTLVSWCHPASYVYRLGHWHVGRRRPSCAVYTMMVHFGFENCCRPEENRVFFKIITFCSYRWFQIILFYKVFDVFRS